MRSMTGYGQASAADESHRISVAMRSVNGRYLDLSLRLDDEHRGLEPALRRLIEPHLHRGRVDLTVDVRSLRPRRATAVLQTDVVRALVAAAHELAEQGLATADLGAADILRRPEALEVRVDPDELGPAGEGLLARVVEEALEQLLAARAREGEQLVRLLDERLRELESAASGLAARAAEVRGLLAENLRRRLEDLLGDQVDPSRLAQEAALLADRADVAEEVDRLGAHLAHFREVMAGDGAIGKRLDFLSQEILRELNTLGSKGRDAALTRLVIDAKAACEQLREQVQNVE